MGFGNASGTLYPRVARLSANRNRSVQPLVVRAKSNHQVIETQRSQRTILSFLCVFVSLCLLVHSPSLAVNCSSECNHEATLGPLCGVSLQSTTLFMISSDSVRQRHVPGACGFCHPQKALDFWQIAVLQV